MQYIHYLKTRLKSHCLLPLIPWSPNPVQSRSFPNFVSTKLIKPMNGRNTVILQFLLIMINNVLASHTQVLQQIFQSLVHLFVIIQQIKPHPPFSIFKKMFWRFYTPTPKLYFTTNCTVIYTNQHNGMMLPSLDLFLLNFCRE